MFVYYTFNKVERERVYKGFEVHRFKINSLVGEYSSKEEAEKHPASKLEEEYPNGCYLFTNQKLDEKIELVSSKEKK